MRLVFQRLLVLLVVAVAGAARELPPRFRNDSHVQAAAIRAHVLSSYDATVPANGRPDWMETTASSRTGADVSMSIKIFKVKNVDIASSSMQLKIWLRLKWLDLRLAWNESEFGGVDKVYFTDGPGTPEFWAPDLQPYNAERGFSATLERGHALVSSDGSIYWSRPGFLDVMCRFSGLVAFPFDKPVCTIEIGGWIFSGAYQGITFEGLDDGKGYEIDKQEATAGASYQQYDIANVSAEIKTYTYAVTPHEPWPVAIYRISLRRASRYYVFLVIFPPIIMAILSFAVFFVPSGAADPLGFGISVIIVALLNNLILINMLPICGEVLWLDLFALNNTTFCVLALFQSALMIAIETTEGEHLFPEWVEELIRLIWKALRHARRCFRCHASCLQSRFPQVLPRSWRASTSPSLVGASGAVPHGRKKPKLPRTRKDPLMESGERRSAAGILKREMPPAPSTGSDVGGGSGGGDGFDGDVAKLQYFEHLFYEIERIDTSSDGYLDTETCRRYFANVLLETSTEDLLALFNTYLENLVELNCLQFVRMCKDCLWMVPREQLMTAQQTLCAQFEERHRSNNNYWRRVAQQVERWSRIIVPSLYLLTLVILFSLDFSDPYSKAGTEMYSGFEFTEFTMHSYRLVIIYGALFAASFAGWLLVKWVARVAAKRSAQAEAKRRKLAQKVVTMDHFKPVKSLDDLKEVALGELGRLNVPSCCVAPLEMPEALHVEAFRFDSRLGAELPPPVRILGPDPLVILLRSIGLRSSDLFLQFSPLDMVNLPIVDRLNAAIPVTAACFAYIYPLGAAPLLDESKRDIILSAIAEGDAASGAELCLNGGFAYLDQSGGLISINAIVSASLDAPQPHFIFNGAFPITELAHKALCSASRYHPITWPAVRKAGGQRVAWIRPAEFTKTAGLIGPFGAFAFCGDDFAHATYFRLIPANLRLLTVVVKFVSPVLVEESRMSPRRPSKMLADDRSVKEPVATRRGPMKRMMTTSLLKKEPSASPLRATKEGFRQRIRPTRLHQPLTVEEAIAQGVDMASAQVDAETGACQLPSMSFPVKTRAWAVKRIIEAKTNVPMRRLGLCGLDGELLVDDEPIEKALIKGMEDEEYVVLECVLGGELGDDVTSLSSDPSGASPVRAPPTPGVQVRAASMMDGTHARVQDLDADHAAVGGEGRKDHREETPGKVHDL